ncbi:MAG TPA: DUF2218 domain-containing protein [Amaricoccus sp.]|uniref:DUF2218 domain-containing protein n=1 Tax=Amaricoccus sp. TaxID=1872485 RepID=UPI002BBB0165|nr:DUF2218 domain-containing protein [Amaricoccus sp.]HMQ93898.1 DUF2218 domain-containing protein [Amaricoccus sp.]HMR51058.1 DUF2218 domain-containing protein [Amaricoccus sp.]HMR60002.1 DUF2218 domain-containing protein [Amaricoccus sp.]HMU00335.1 DUF2218 domain-containing protein [Amaricoccus sp.]
MGSTISKHVSEAIVRTEKAGRYLQQLSKHFGHKVPVQGDERQCHIGFPMGACTLEAEPGSNTLTLRLTAATAKDVGRLEEIVGGHLVRFAFREDLRVDWNSIGKA